MAHHPDLAYADYFAAGGVTTTVVPEVDAGDGDPHHHLYGVHQPGTEEAFGASRGLLQAEMAAAHGKAALGGGHFVDFSEHAHRQQQQEQGHNHAPLTSLSLHGPAEAASLALHQLAGAAHRQHQQAWPRQQQGAWHMRGSRFLLPTQQLLQEFCSIPVEITAGPKATKPLSNEDGSAGSSSSAAPSAQIQAMDAAELQRLKAKLYTMLDEVDRRYRRYREQMRSVAGSFEAVAGAQAATAYTRLASRTISRHFRTLRDGLAAQVEAVRRALGEKDAAAGVVAKGETTPRLRALEQCLRQQRAYHTGVMESQPWRPQRGLPERAVSILRAWLFEHFLHPYPSDMDKHILARQTGLSRSQVSNWFINARVRLWKPMVEEMYAEEMKDPDEGAGCSDANGNDHPNHPSHASEGQGRGGEDGGGERKPTRAQLVLHDAGSLASVVSVGSRDQQSLGFDVMDNHLGFGAYDDAHAAAGGQGFGGGPGGGSGGVSLTLGLQQQHADPHGGVNIAFAGATPSAAHEFMFMAGGEQQMVAGGGGGGAYSGDHHHGYQFVSGMQGDTVPASKTNYHRGVSATGFQLLHDLAG